MQIVSVNTMKSLVKHAVAKRRAITFHGPSGIGKSEGVAQVTNEIDGILCDIRVSQYESVDFRGIPDLDSDSPTTVWRMPATLPFKGNPNFVENDRPIVLFLDEFNQGSASVMAVCYQLVNDHRVGEHQLMDNVSIVMAGNRAADKGVTNKVPAPLNNRSQHFELQPSVEGWTQWAAQSGVPTDLIGFLNFRPSLLHTFDPKASDPVFASPRTWGFAAEDYADKSMDNVLRWVSIPGSVGDGPAAEFQAFIELMNDLPNISAILSNPEMVPVPDASDKQWAAATMISGQMKCDDKLPQFQKYLDRLEPEMAVVAWTMALARDEALLDTNTFMFSYAKKYRSLFTR